jgi:release factor glutamine methyltransferase
MNIEAWLNKSVRHLQAAGVGTARLDALVLLENATGKDRGWLLAHPESELEDKILRQLQQQVERRSRHEPLAYIRGKTEFYGREFIVSNAVLEPRPESETMIDLLKSLTLPDNATIIDIGTGSGALAITAKLELPDTTVTAADIDPKCLEIARKNAGKHGTDISFLQGDLLQPVLDAGYDLARTTLLCNLPYVPNGFNINTAAGHEPRHAIFGGLDGLDLYRTLFAQLADMPTKPLYICCESLPTQHKTLAHLARSRGLALATSEDFIQIFEPI